MSREAQIVGIGSPRTDEANARLAAIVESSDDAIVSKDLNGTIITWNPGAERLFGYTAGEAIGRSIRLIIPPERQAEEDEVLRRISRGEKLEHFETVRCRKDGRRIFISLTVSPIRDARGVIVGASKIARDITARIRESQRAAFFADTGPILASSLDYTVTLANIARLTTTVFSGTTSPIADYVIVDILERDGRFRRVAAAHRNPDKERFLDDARNYAPDPARSLLARPLRTGQPLFLPALTASDVESLSLDESHTRVMVALAPRSLITAPLTARGSTFGLFTFVRSESPDAFDADDLAFAVEIARRAALAVDNARLYEESLQAVQTREQVLAVVSHDLRNSLGAIATSARLLLVGGTDEQQRARRLQTMIRVCDRMNRLMQDLLDTSRLQAGRALVIEPSAQDAAALVREACESFRAQADERLITLEHDAPPMPAAWGDRGRLLQVLTNLIGNAVKFTPEGGAVAVRTEKDGSFVRFSVSDTGPGIAAQDLDRIFEQYWQVRATASRGTGLGLPIAKGIVEAHEGRIWVESKPGVGATFFFTIPIAE